MKVLVAKLYDLGLSVYLGFSTSTEKLTIFSIEVENSKAHITLHSSHTHYYVLTTISVLGTDLGNISRLFTFETGLHDYLPRGHWRPWICDRAVSIPKC